MSTTRYFNRLSGGVRPRLFGAVAIVCVLLMGVSGYDAIHVHRAVGPLESAPLGPHHCLLCLAAHLPVTVTVDAAAPVPAFTCASYLPPDPVGSYESSTSFSLHTRPPPLV